jgi:hypothetical protein
VSVLLFPLTGDLVNRRAMAAAAVERESGEEGEVGGLETA